MAANPARSATPHVKAPPHALEAERAVLGGLLLANQTWERVADRLTESDFFRRDHRLIFRAVAELAEKGQPFDVVTLREWLDSRGETDSAGGAGYLIALAKDTPSAANITAYAEIVREKAVLRRLIDVGTEMVSRAYSPDDGGAAFIIAQAERDVAAMGSQLTATAPPRTRTRCMADIEPERVRWLWPSRFAEGKVSMLVGDPGNGKSIATADAAARVSTGSPWPDGAECPKGAVVILSAEDDASDTIRPRLDAAGADPSKVFLLEAVRDVRDGRAIERHFNLQEDLERLAEVVASVEARLVIVDPISAYLGKTDSHNNSDVRAALAPLQRMAGEYGCAVLVVTHLNKSSGQSALYRTTGSLAFTAAARSVYAVVRDPENAARRLILPIKNNLGDDQGGLAYSIVTAPNGAPVLDWEPEPVSVSADEAMGPALNAEDREERDDAAGWIREYLADGPKPAKEVRRDAEEAGFPWRTIQRARKRAGAETERAGFQGGTRWYLPGANHRAFPEGGADGADGADGEPRGFPGGADGDQSRQLRQSRRESNAGTDGADAAEGEL